MLESFGSQTHLLHCVRDYLIHTCLEGQNTLQQLNIKGRDLDFIDCDVCLKNFSKTITYFLNFFYIYFFIFIWYI